MKIRSGENARQTAKFPLALSDTHLGRGNESGGENAAGADVSAAAGNNGGGRRKPPPPPDML